MIWNPIVPKISSLNNLTFFVEDFVALHNNFESYVTKFGQINAKEKSLEESISSIEKLIVDLLCEYIYKYKYYYLYNRVFPESRSSYEIFLESDSDYRSDKYKIIYYDVNDDTYTGLFYLWYFIKFGDDDSKLTRVYGDMIENPDIEVFYFYFFIFNRIQ